MKLSTSFIALALAFPSFAIASPQDDARVIPKPLVSSTALQALTSKLTLLGHAQQFLKFSQLSDGTRAFGSRGHNATVNYIKGLLDATRYYDTELQTFPYLFSSGDSTFAVNNNAVESEWFTYGPAGDVTAPLVPVANLGCESVALAGAAKAAGAIIYNNAPEGVNGGTLARPNVQMSALTSPLNFDFTRL
ncbi:hypothetical protein NMY22_g18065 [Coprinellus aureogranulatus]|nr:hypothetical protein NMY22_g18065 [Coprinellus aureogranulatus]